MRKFSHRDSSHSHIEDQQAHAHPVSARVAEIAEQIKEIANLNMAYRSKPVHTQVDRSAHQVRELRLIQIKEELQQMRRNIV